MSQSAEVPLLRARALRKDHGRAAGLVRAVDEVDLEVPAGQAVAVMGPSGCGKSTLLHLLGGLERPTSGEVWLGERRIDTLNEKALARLRRDSIGFVFQAFHLMDELTAVENVELPALLAGRSAKAARRRAADLLDRVGLADQAKRLPTELSGGQRQRVAVARALSNDPEIVLADEPTGNLDSAATLEVLRLFDRLRADGQTLVIVTHDARIAATADRLISMRDGALVDETRLTGGSAGDRGGFAGAGGLDGLVGLAGLAGLAGDLGILSDSGGGDLLGRMGISGWSEGDGRGVSDERIRVEDRAEPSAHLGSDGDSSRADVPGPARLADPADLLDPSDPAAATATATTATATATSDGSGPAIPADRSVRTLPVSEA